MRQVAVILCTDEGARREAARDTSLFEKTKKIFDPLNIFNPGKKVGGTFADIKRDMIKEKM